MGFLYQSYLNHGFDVQKVKDKSLQDEASPDMINSLNMPKSLTISISCPVHNTV